jgi:nucleotide-binding universal stress UspA family protein
MIFIVPRVSRWFFRRLEGEKNSQYIFVLSVVFFCAFLSELAGLEPIIGAFAAGLALNGIIPQTSPLMNRVEFVGNSLFIPFFLISVGMVVNVKVLLAGPQALIVAGVLTTFALTSKWLAAWVTGAILRFPAAQRNLMFGLSSAHAAATLAVILVGFEIGIVDEPILNGTVILILVTCLVASMVTDAAGKKVAISLEQAPKTALPKTGEKILVPVANPQTVEKLIDLAYAFKGIKAPYPLYGLTVVEDNEEAEFRLVQSRKALDEAHRYVVSFGGHFEAISTIDQNIASGIKRVAREIGATDIVMGSTDKSNLTDLIFGKMVEQVTESSSEAVWLLHPVRALADHKRLHIVCPKYSEKEPGFVDWLTKASRLAAVMNMRTTLHTSQETFTAALATLEHHKIRFKMDFSAFEDWGDFLVLAREFGIGSFIMVVAPRKGSISFVPEGDQVPRRLAKHFNAYTYLIVYPENRHGEEIRDFTREFDPTLLEIGLNQVKKSATGLGRLLRGESNKKD